MQLILWIEKKIDNDYLYQYLIVISGFFSFFTACDAVKKLVNHDYSVGKFEVINYVFFITLSLFIILKISLFLCKIFTNSALFYSKSTYEFQFYWSWFCFLRKAFNKKLINYTDKNYSLFNFLAALKEWHSYPFHTDEKKYSDDTRLLRLKNIFNIATKENQYLTTHLHLLQKKWQAGDLLIQWFIEEQKKNSLYSPIIECLLEFNFLKQQKLSFYFLELLLNENIFVFKDNSHPQHQKHLLHLVLANDLSKTTPELIACILEKTQFNINYIDIDGNTIFHYFLIQKNLQLKFLNEAKLIDCWHELLKVNQLTNLVLFDYTNQNGQNVYDLMNQHRYTEQLKKVFELEKIIIEQRALVHAMKDNFIKKRTIKI